MNFTATQQPVPTSSASSLQEQLPEECLVPFECQRLRTARVVLNNRSLGLSDDELDQFQFAVRREEDADAYSNERRTFYGERYGGYGLGTNGGGVRCGIHGRYHVKGIGKNPLAGVGVDFWHSHGGATLLEGLMEALWGEVVHHALPHGAVRVPAVISTGTRSVEKAPDGVGRVYSPRALIVRENALRPAHFFRGATYRPTSFARQHFAHDTDRTRAAIQCLPRLLPRPREFGEDHWGSLPTVRRLQAGMEEMVSRFAQQMAVARARRVVHGAISPSNICLDGRWVDFGTTSILRCYANVLVGDVDPFWEEHVPIYRTLDDLCFYVFKYLKVEDTNQLPSSSQLKGSFFHRFETEL